MRVIPSSCMSMRRAEDMFLESEDDLRRYRTMFDHLRASALSPTRSADLITSVKGELLE